MKSAIAADSKDFKAAKFGRLGQFGGAAGAKGRESKSEAFSFTALNSDLASGAHVLVDVRLAAQETLDHDEYQSIPLEHTHPHGNARALPQACEIRPQLLSADDAARPRREVRDHGIQEATGWKEAMETAIPETGNVLIVEDQAFVAMAATTLLTQSRPGLTAVVCATAQQTMDALAVEPERFYRILLDLDVPGAHRLSLAMHIKELGLQDRCCIVTAHNRSDLAGELKEQGFLGYVLKSMPIDEFAAAMRLIFLGQQVFVPLEGHAEAPGALRLTRRQAQVLDLVRHGQNSKQIASALALSVGRVDNIISATLDVLGATSRTHAVSKAVALGLISAPDGSDWDSPTPHK